MLPRENFLRASCLLLPCSAMAVLYKTLILPGTSPETGGNEDLERGTHGALGHVSKQW